MGVIQAALWECGHVLACKGSCLANRHTGRAAGHGFEVHVWCSRCHPWGCPTIPAERLGRRFAGTRFRYPCGAPGYQHCSEEHLHRYLAEFDFRYSHRAKLGVSDRERADKALNGIEGKRLTYRRINEKHPETN